MIRIALASFAALFTKAPIGSTFEHTFIDRYGRPVVETYRIQPDRSLLLIHRYTRIEYF